MLMFSPKEFERNGQCAEHGMYLEKGYSLRGAIENAHWAGCSQCNELARAKEDEKDAQAEQTRRQAIIEQRLHEAGIPKAYVGKGFSCFHAESAEEQAALTIARDYAASFWKEKINVGGSLILAGSVGTGKSHLALAVAQHVMKRGTVIYSDISGIIRSVRSTWSRNSELTEAQVFDMYTSGCDLLIIDEVGVQRGSVDEQNTLFDIINRRYRENQPMVLITNLGGEEFKTFLGERSYDRLIERAQFIPCFWESYRGRLARANQEVAA